MNERIREKLLQIPEAPGVYQMLDRDRNIIYIGKSKCLKKRVHSYFVPSPKWEKVKKMVPFISDIEWKVTDTHLEAMLLECKLIKEKKPYFNALMKNDGRYFYLSLGQNVRVPSISITYSRQEVSYGPFRRRGPMEVLIQTMKNFYPLCISEGNFDLTYHIFPVSMNRQEYEENYKVLYNMFTQPELLKAFQSSVEGQMTELAGQQKFELAIRYRSLIESLEYVQKKLNYANMWLSKEILYTVQMGIKFKYFYIKNGLIVYSRIYAGKTADRKQKFIKAAKGKESKDCNITDKSKLDYLDILIAELQQASPDDIELL